MAPTFTLLQVTAAAATNLATSCVLANQIKGVLKTHFLDASAHLKADLVNDGYLDGYSFVDGYSTVDPPAQGIADLASVIVLLNGEKAVFNKHLSQSGVHVSTDGRTVATTDATDQTSANTLANALKAAVNLHVSSGPVGIPRISLVSA
jgi:hypothetical protein